MALSPLEKLQALNPKQAATFCERSRTVRAWRKKVTRRADGTIVGYYDGAGSQWEEYRLTLAEAVKRAERKAAARESVKRDQRQTLERLRNKREALSAEIAQLQEADVSAFPAIVQESVSAQLAQKQAELADIDAHIAQEAAEAK